MESLNLNQRLAKIRALSDAVQKDRQGYGYKYADITSILANVTAGMKKYGVSLIPSIVPGTTCVKQNVTVNTKVDKTGNAYNKTVTEMLVTGEMVFSWVNDDNPTERIDVPWVLVGCQEDPSQALGAALTYTTRYFLTSYFSIAQPENDVDAYRSKQKEAEASEEKALTKEIIQTIDTTVRTYLSDNPDKKEEVSAFMSKYDKNSNYMAIKEPVLASKLLNDFNRKFNKTAAAEHSTLHSEEEK